MLSIFRLFKSVYDFVHPTIKFLTDVLPEYKTYGSACFDIMVDESYTLKPGELHNFPTGLRAEIPHNYCVLIFPRSSLGQKKIIIPNSVGVIDSDYRGEIQVPLFNLSDEERTVMLGDRVAQGLLVSAKQCAMMKVDFLTESKRGSGGFGSTGK